MNKDYLAEFDQAPPEDQYPLVYGWMQSEPLPFFKQLREQRPVLVTPVCTLLASAKDVYFALETPDLFTTDLYKEKMGVKNERSGYMSGHGDNPLHTREKAIMQSILDRDDLPKIRQLVGQEAQKIIENANGSMDVVTAYCRELPTIIAREYFGFDKISSEKLQRWAYWSQYDNNYNYDFNCLSQEDRQKITKEYLKSCKELIAYTKSLLIRKLLFVKFLEPLFSLLRINKRDTIVKRLLRTNFGKSIRFPLKRVGINVGGLLVGSIETTSQAAADAIHFLLQNPMLLSQAKVAAQTDDNKELENIVWEILRFKPLCPFLFRQLSQDYCYAKGTEQEVLLPKGTTTLLLTQSAMFDAEYYKNSEQFNAQRRHYRHLAFGVGSHQCLGKHIAMAVVPEMVKHIVLCEELSEESEMDFKGSPFPESYTLNWKQ